MQPAAITRRARAGLLLLAAAGLAAASAAHAQGAGSAPLPRAQATIDITGEWISIVTEDWKFRMVTPNAGVYAGIPLNAEGRRAADAWDPARDEAAGDACRAYGAASIMRMPGRLRITWQDDATLRIDTQAGEQTRLLHFTETVPDARTWQGTSRAQWRPAAWRGQGEDAVGGSLEVATTHMRPGYLRKNGVPYSEDAVLTEHFNRLTAPNGDEWLVVTTIVDDPVYLNRPYVTSSHFKKLPNASAWSPAPCAAR